MSESDDDTDSKNIELSSPQSWSSTQVEWEFEGSECESDVDFCSESPFQYALNSIGGSNGFRACNNKRLREGYVAQVEQYFGNDTRVVFSAQNYEKCVDGASYFNNIIEIFNVREGTTFDNIYDIYGELVTDAVWMTDDSALLIFGSEGEVNVGIRIESDLFQSRKLLYGSDEALLFAFDFVYPKDGPNIFHIQYES
ncbi:hypothetical protein RI129_011819 [Pyrocoelia pectoralis]|uniref:Uncharacterized protein n=1 Tax=Pyrocoelia pectoralis TaxID=417401 RepID=A0AAN7V0X1_9COLE